MSEMDIRRRFPAGAVIFHEGAPGDCAYVIEAGEVEISIRRDGRTVVLARRGVGEIVGEMAIVDAAARSATVTATSECRLLILTRDQLHSRLRRLDPVLRMVFGVVLERFRDSLKSMRGEAAPAAATPVAPPPETAAAEGLGEAFQSAIDRIELEQELRRGVAAGEIEFHHQPLVSAGSRRIVGYEALARWRHQDFGLVSPGRFIPVAEETGLVRDISKLAVASAAIVAARLRQRDVGDANLFVSANVTAEDLCDPGFFEHVSGALRAAALPPSGLVLEITESTLIENAEQALAMLQRYRDLGVGVSIDDFGAGYSNFSYLARYPVQTIKIDKSVVDQLDGGDAPSRDRGDRGAKLVKAMVTMAHALDLKIVAEGVETPTQADVLRDLGCDVLQGYYFGRPELLAEACASAPCAHGLPAPELV